MGARLGDGGLRRPRGPPGTPRSGRAHRRRRGPPVVVSLRTPPLPGGAPGNATGHELLTAGSAPMPVASAPRAAPLAARRAAVRWLAVLASRMVAVQVPEAGPAGADMWPGR